MRCRITTSYVPKNDSGPKNLEIYTESLIFELSGMEYLEGGGFTQDGGAFFCYVQQGQEKR